MITLGGQRFVGVSKADETRGERSIAGIDVLSRENHC
jgi:hypothetical protein